MDAITQWFKENKDYNVGVALYASLPTKKISVLKRLNRGKNNHNMATLVSELRHYKNAPVPNTPKPKKIIETPKKPTTQQTINIEAERRHISTQAVNREFGNIRLGDLPPELRPKFLRAQAVFYDMIELKFALNDLPKEAEDSALNIILQIEALDEERDILWKQLHHWKNHKTILSLDTKENLTGLSPLQLDLKKRNLRSSISKITSRINTWYKDLEAETNVHKQRLIENKINRSEKLVFKHEQTINKINKTL
jgi:hypothetical protein